MKYTAIIEKTDTGYSAYMPDVPGCVATGRTLAAVRRNIGEALRFHLEGLQIEGEPLPVPSAVSIEILQDADSASTTVAPNFSTMPNPPATVTFMQKGGKSRVSYSMEMGPLDILCTKT